MEYIGQPTGAPTPYVDPFKDLNASTRSRLDTAVRKIGKLPTQYRKYEIIQLFKLLDALKAKTSDTYKLLVVDYLQQQLADMYPEL